MTAPGRIRPGGSQDPSSASWLAERALLGALLHQPARIAAVRQWLRPHDFANAAHGELYQRIEQLHTSGQVPTPTAGPVSDLGDAARRTLLYTLQTQTHGPPELVELHQLGTTATANHYVRHARLILEASIRQQLKGLAFRLAPGHQGVDAERPLADLTTLAARLRQASGGQQASINLGSGIDASPPISVPAPPPPTLVARAERLLLHAAINDPQWRDTGILTRLQPEDFTGDPTHATAWRAIQNLAHRGEPIDIVMVAWEAETILASQPPDDLRTHAHGQALSRLAAITEPPSPDNTHRALRVVTQAAQAHHARQAAQEISAAASNRQIHVNDALTRAEAATKRLGEHLNRLTADILPQGSSIRTALDSTPRRSGRRHV